MLNKKHLQAHLNNVNRPSFPSNIQMAKNLGQSIVRNVQSVAAGNPLNVSDSVAQSRLSVCNGCEFFDKVAQRCSKCGCKMAIKTYLKAEKCPVGKW